MCLVVDAAVLDAGRAERRRPLAIPELLEVEVAAAGGREEKRRLEPRRKAAERVDALREQHEAVAELAFRRYHCNQWTAKVSAWLPAGAWQACAGERSFEEGERIWVGVDVGGERSDSAVV